MAGMAEGLVRRPATPSGPGTWRGLQHEAPAPPHGPQGNSSCQLPGSPSLGQSGSPPHPTWPSPRSRLKPTPFPGFYPLPYSHYLPWFFPKTSLSAILLAGKPHPWEAASGSGLVPTCVFQQCLGRVGPVDDLHQIVEDHLHIGLHLCP